MKRAMFFDKCGDGKVNCRLCPQNCVIKPDGIGLCGARKNIGGELYSLNYGKATSLAFDPIEKKPLYHFCPGSYILSAGTFGCNLMCPFCQNWSISRMKDGDGQYIIDVTPESLVSEALKLVKRGNIGLAFTYNEPSVWYEFVLETAGLSKSEGLKNVLVTNGFISEEPLKKLLPEIHAMNIDLKAFTQDYYKKICKGNIDDVKRTIEIASKSCHVEITTLVIPGLNDSPEEIGSLARWISTLSPSIPLHLSRYFPAYEMDDRPPTPVEALEKARDAAFDSLKYVYLGNVGLNRKIYDNNA
jgi:pyruvate formate lyase activating enzyme